MPERLVSLELAATILARCAESGARADQQLEALTIARLVVSNAVEAARPTSLGRAPGPASSLP